MSEGSLVFHRDLGRGIIISCSLFTLSSQKGFIAKVRFKSGIIQTFNSKKGYISEQLHHIKRH